MLSNGSRRIAQALGLCWVAFCAPRASAAPSAPAVARPVDVQAARDLFGLAEADEDGGRWAAALEKLGRVLAIRDTPGVRYHVALCEEQLGKLVAAEADFRAADTAARAAQAQDVLRLVGKKLAQVERRLAHVTVRLAPAAPDASVTLDGSAVRAGEATVVDPGPHEIQVVSPGRGAPSSVSFAVGEGEDRTVDVGLSPAPPDAPASDEPAAAPAPAPRRAPPPPGKGAPRTAAMLEAAGAALLAGGGALAYAAGGAARDQAAHTCALVDAPSPAACDPYRVPVRAWDWVAVGAWAGAGAMATWAVVTWVTGPGSTARVVAGAATLRLEGGF